MFKIWTHLNRINIHQSDFYGSEASWANAANKLHLPVGKEFWRILFTAFKNAEQNTQFSSLLKIFSVMEIKIEIK